MLGLRASEDPVEAIKQVPTGLLDDADARSNPVRIDPGFAQQLRVPDDRRQRTTHFMARHREGLER